MEDSIPHGCRLIDLNELRNGLKSCQVCKSGEKIPDILFQVRWQSCTFVQLKTNKINVSCIITITIIIAYFALKTKLN